MTTQLRSLEEEIVDLRRRISDEEQTEARLRSEADQVRAGIQDKVENHGADRFSSENIAAIEGAYREPDELRDRIYGLRTHLTQLLERSSREGGGGRLGAGVEHLEKAARRGDPLARAFLESDVYERLRPLLRSQARIESDPVEVLERSDLLAMLRSGGRLQQRVTFDTTQGGALIPVDQQVYPPVALPARQVRLVQLITTGTTDSDVVKWAQQTSRTDVAAETPFGTAAPEGALAFAAVQSNVQRIPAFIPATRDQLADQGQTETLIEGQLRGDVMRRVDAQILNGTGTNQLPGISTTSGIGTVVARDAGHVGEFDLDTIYRAITTVRLALFDDPTAVVLHPTDYQTLILQKDSQNRYVYQPTGGTDGNAPIWGLTAIVNTVTTQGTSWVADFAQAYTLWVREGLTVTASDGYQDYFTRGMVAVLATMRAAGGVQQPKAVCKITGL